MTGAISISDDLVFNVVTPSSECYLVIAVATIWQIVSQKTSSLASLVHSSLENNCSSIHFLSFTSFSLYNYITKASFKRHIFCFPYFSKVKVHAHKWRGHLWLTDRLPSLVTTFAPLTFSNASTEGRQKLYILTLVDLMLFLHHISVFCFWVTICDCINTPIAKSLLMFGFTGNIPSTSRSSRSCQGSCWQPRAISGGATRPNFLFAKIFRYKHKDVYKSKLHSDQTFSNLATAFR